MKKVFATVTKEWILMRRDIAGLLVLFIMPAILMVIMALVEDAPFRDYQEMHFDVLVADNDHGALAQQIKNGLRQSKNFRVVDSMNGTELDEVGMKGLLQKGKYKIGIAIPKGVTAEVANTANIIANNISSKIGAGAMLPTRAARDSIFIRVYFDPVSEPAFRTAISLALDKYITYSSSNALMQRLAALNKTQGDTANQPDLKKLLQGIGIKEVPLNNKGRYTKNINSVQHNVPAWAIFGIFFIVASIASHMIKERSEGSAVRIALIPHVYGYVVAGKIILYTLICTFQFFLMCCIGIWIIPLFGLPALYLGAYPLLLLPVSIVISFAATSYGYFIGSIFKTANQAVPFGTISIVIFSAIGSVWIPIELLSSSIQHIAIFSPLHWSLEAVHDIIIRNEGIVAVSKPISVLLVFGISLCLASVYINNRRYRSVQ